jgi:hypothetical protein
MLEITKPSKQPLPPITMRNRLWSGSWCSDWRACCGGRGGQRPSRQVFSKSRRDHLSEFRKSHRMSPASREIVYALCNANSGRQAASYGVANTTEMSPASRLASQVEPDVELARCFLRPIMPSIASVAMKPLFGVKSGRFYLRSTIWIAASRMRECDVRWR